jgi:hypothetical protein
VIWSSLTLVLYIVQSVISPVLSAIGGWKCYKREWSKTLMGLAKSGQDRIKGRKNKEVEGAWIDLAKAIYRKHFSILIDEEPPHH